MATELVTGGGSGSIQANSADVTALRSLKGWALTFSGEIGERIPQRVAKLVPSALKAAKAQLRGADPKILAIELDGLLTWARTFNVPVDDPQSVTRFYAEGLASVPGDLLPLAMRRARAAHKYGMRLPLPAEIIATVEPELIERRTLVSKLARATLAAVEYEGGKVDSRVTGLTKGLTAHLKRHVDL